MDQSFANDAVSQSGLPRPELSDADRLAANSVHAGHTHDGAGPALVLRLIARLSQIVSDENTAIKAGPGADVSSFVEAKNRGLYELELALRAVGDPMVDPRTRDAVRDLYQALAVNQTLLGAQVKAVGEAIGIIESLSGAGRSDGTYGNPARRKPAAYL